IEPVVRRPAPDGRRTEEVDGGLGHDPRVAAKRRRRRRRWELGRTSGPASPPSPFTPPPTPSHRDPEYGAHTPARVATRIPEPPRAPILEPLTQFRPDPKSTRLNSSH